MAEGYGSELPPPGGLGSGRGQVWGHSPELLTVIVTFFRSLSSLFKEKKKAAPFCMLFPDISRLALIVKWDTLQI